MNQADINQLSKRETEVLHLIVQGLSSKQIAEQMQVQHETIRTYRKRIYAKLQVHSLVELMHLYNNHSNH